MFEDYSSADNPKNHHRCYNHKAMSGRKNKFQTDKK